MYYKYKITFWNDFENLEDTAEGIVYAKNYGKAAMKLVEDYAECIIDIYLCELDTAKTIDIDDIKYEFKLD